MKKPTAPQLSNILLGIIIIGLAWFIVMPKAQAGGYGGLSYSNIDTDISDHTGSTIHGGYNFNSIVAIEGRYLLSSSEENYQGVNVEIEDMVGIYIIGTIPVTDSLGVYALFGHSEGTAKASYMGYSESADESSSSFGFGVKYDIVEAWTVRLEHTEVFDDVTQTSATLTLNF